MYPAARNPARMRRRPPSGQMGIVPIALAVSVGSALKNLFGGGSTDVSGESDPNVAKIRAIRDTDILAQIARGDVTGPIPGFTNGSVNWSDGKVGRPYERQVAQDTLNQIVQGLVISVTPST